MFCFVFSWFFILAFFYSIIFYRSEGFNRRRDAIEHLNDITMYPLLTPSLARHPQAT